ncbi:NAD(P)H-binding protein [Natronomonas sp. EA1]|uniref:NAD(P)H-binding protein n=1 Tax=Natronomonas sp. EA1 TaxID=3421655 RepID=UPI003EC1061C
MRTLVTGATGCIGSRLVRVLHEAGHDVVALVRDPARYDPPPGVTVAVGDLLGFGWEDALEGVDAAYYLVHSMGGGEGYAERDRRAAHNFAAAAAEAGVDRVIYLGGLGDDDADLSPHLKSRREVEYILAEGDYDFTALRAGIIIGAGSTSFELVRQLAKRLPVMVTPKWVQTRCQPIALADVIAYLAGVLDAPETRGETYEIGGPEVMTYETVLRAVARIDHGREPVIIRVPVLTPWLSALWLRLVTDVPTSVAHPLVLGLKNAVVVTDDRIREHVPLEPTPFETAVERALGREPEPVPVEVA